MKTAEVRPIEILLVEDSPSDAEFTVAAIQAARVRHHLSLVEDGVQAMEFLCAVRDGTPRPRDPI
jgi:two-component system response regulator